MSLALLGTIREIIGAGSFLNIPFADFLSNYTQTIFILAPGGFLTLGLLMGFFNYLALRKKRGKQKLSAVAPQMYKPSATVSK